MGFKVTKNGKTVGDKFDSREEAMESARLEKLADPSAEVKVEVFITIGGDNPRKDAQDLVDAILEGEDFSDLPPEHQGPIHAPTEDHDEASDEKESNKATPPKSDCYFVRFTRSMLVRDEDLENLWDDDKVTIHLPGPGDSPDLESLDPEEYSKGQRWTMRILRKLADEGGYVWFESHLRDEAKVGVVGPGTEIENSPATYVEPKHPKHESKAGKAAILKAIQMEQVMTVEPGKERPLWASRPVTRSLVQWQPACGEARLIALIEGAEAEDGRLRWDDLSPDLQTTLCLEFLRHHENPDYPRLKHLLLPPGRRAKDIDIYGVAEDGKEMLAQVPFTKHRHHELHEAEKKAHRLKKYRGPGRTLISFRPSHLAPRPEQRSLFKKPVPVEKDGVLYIRTKEVHDWMRENPDYDERVFGL